MKNSVVSGVLMAAINWVVTESWIDKNWKLEDWNEKQWKFVLFCFVLFFFFGKKNGKS